MAGEVEAVREALAAGAATARRAAREAAAPLAVSAAGWTAVFTAGRAELPPEAATALGWTGFGLVLLMAAPKLGALHRLAAGAEALDPPGPLGLQWTALEGRLAATATALGAAAALVVGAWGAAAAVLLAALHPLGRVDLGPLGRWSAGFLLSAPVLLAGAAAAAAAIGRLCVLLAAEAAEPRPRFARGWLLTRGAAAPAACVWLLTAAAPLLALLGAEAAMEALGGRGPAGRWSPAEAAAVGGALAFATQFVSAPLNAGALAELRRAGLRRERAREAPPAVDTPGPLGDKAPAPPRPSRPELLPA